MNWEPVGRQLFGRFDNTPTLLSQRSSGPEDLPIIFEGVRSS
jgi:hypothetical protein